MGMLSNMAEIRVVESILDYINELLNKSQPPIDEAQILKLVRIRCEIIIKDCNDNF